MYCMNTMAQKLSFTEPTAGPCFGHFALIIKIIVILVHVVKHQSVLINTCRINVTWWAILNIVYSEAMYTVFIIM